MKKTVSVTLSFILILSMIMSTFLFVSAPANADSENVVTGSCGEKVTYSLNKDTGVLTISGTGEMNDYAWSKSPFFNSGDIKTVVIEKGVTKIGQYVFDSCYELTKVTIPDSLETIGRYAFYYCEKLPKIHINKVATLDTGAFQGCSSLKYFICGKSLTNIEDMAFSGCTALHYIFYEGTQTEFKNISVGSSNSNFTSGVSRYDKMIFTSDYMGFYITGENDDEVSLEWYLGDKTVVEIPAVLGSYPVTTLDYAFSDNDNITSVTIPDSVTAITGIAFCDCEKLESVTIGKNVKTIGDNAFMNCISLKSITIPDGVTSLGEEVFSGCSLLESVKIGNGVTELKDAAFYNCEN